MNAVRSLFATLTMWCACLPLSAKEPDQNAGQTIWVAFECHFYASMAEDEKETGRLFLLGHERGKQFMMQAIRGEISDEYLYSDTPMGIALRMRDGAPSVEFLLGRIYEEVVTDAAEKYNSHLNDEMLEQNAIGVDLPFDQLADLWRMKLPDFEKDVAQNLYNENNCSLIQ